MQRPQEMLLLLPLKRGSNSEVQRLRTLAAMVPEMKVEAPWWPDVELQYAPPETGV